MIMSIPVAFFRVERLAMADQSSFHEQLLKVVCGQDEHLTAGSSIEHRQSMALSTLMWVAALKVNQPHR